MKHKYIHSQLKLTISKDLFVFNISIINLKVSSSILQAKTKSLKSQKIKLFLHTSKTYVKQCLIDFQCFRNFKKTCGYFFIVCVKLKIK